MAERKTCATDASVSDFIDGLENESRRRDCRTVSKIMRRVSGKKARMWGPGIIGFGVHYYTLASGKQSDICKIGFSPRKSALAFYLADFPGKDKLLAALGKHRMSPNKGGGCMYINRLDDVDLAVLEEIIDKAYRHNLQS